MEYCSLDDAFPASGVASSGCRDTSATTAQGRNERRRAKKCRGPQADYLNDPDRPSLSSAADEPDYMRGSGTGTNPAMQNVGHVEGMTNPYNSATGLFENGPLGEDPMIGSSGGPAVQLPNGQSVDELLVRAPKSAYVERRAPKTPATSTRLVETEGPAKLTPSKVPSYFGADLNDDGEGFLDLKSNAAKKTTMEGYASYNPSTSNKDEYMMSTDFANTFGLLGKDKAAGQGLPVPSVVDSWKRMTPSGAQSAFIDALPLPGGTYPNSPNMGSDTGDIKRHLDKIFSRLDDLENSGRYAASENNQMEIFMFILSGMFVMFTVDQLCRRLR